MSSGPILAVVLQKENAVSEFRNCIVNINWSDAKDGTILREFAKYLQENAIHGSDSNQNALI